MHGFSTHKGLLVISIILLSFLVIACGRGGGGGGKSPSARATATAEALATSTPIPSPSPTTESPTLTPTSEPPSADTPTPAPTETTPPSPTPADVVTAQGAMRIDFIDVGQGDATLVTASNGEILLVDGGRSKVRIRERLAAMGITDLDAVLATHSDADHIAGLIEVFDLFSVERFYWNGQTHDTLTFQNLMAAAEAEGAAVTISRAGDQISLGDISIQVVHPGSLSGDSNVDSIVLMVSCGTVEILLTGDAEIPSEDAMLAGGLLADIDILKVGHHGSRTSTSDAFLSTLAPEVGVISAGLSNQYGHPHQEVVDRLTLAGVQLWYTDITDQPDTVTLVSNCQTYSLEQAGSTVTAPTPTPTIEMTATSTPEPTPSVTSTVDPGSIIVTEFMADPSAVTDANGEWLELYNPGDVSVDINNWTLRDLGSNSHVINSGGPLVIQPQTYLVLGRNADLATNGGIALGYEYSGFTLGNSDDEIELVDVSGIVIDTVIYSAAWVSAGASVSLNPNSLDAVANDNQANWCTASAVLQSGDRGTPGSGNDPC